MGVIFLLILSLFLLAAFPTWPQPQLGLRAERDHRRVVIVLLVLLLTDRL